MWLFNISKTWYEKFRDHRGGLNLDWKIIYTFVRGELEKDFETLSLSRGWNPRRRICTSEGQHRCIACTSTRSYFFFSSFFSPLLLNTRILSTRSFRSGFRVFRLSGVTSSSRGSLIKSRWKFWVSGHPLTQFRGLPRWEIIGGSNWPRNNKLSIGEISKTDTFSTIDSIYFIYFQFKGEIQGWTKRSVVQALSSRYFFNSNICSKLSEVNFASCIKTISIFSLFLSKFFDAIFHEISPLRLITLLFRCSCKITLNRISINIPIARGRTRSASIRSIDSCARD